MKFKDAKVIDRQTNDTVNVEMENLKCALLSNSPIIYASVFEVTHIDQHYILHVLFDDRTIFNKKKVEFKATEKCYYVADLDPKRIEQYLEGFFVAFGLDGVGAALFEGRTGDKTGTATHGKGDGEGI